MPETYSTIAFQRPINGSRVMLELWQLLALANETSPLPDPASGFRGRHSAGVRAALASVARVVEGRLVPAASTQLALERAVANGQLFDDELTPVARMARNDASHSLVARVRAGD